MGFAAGRIHLNLEMLFLILRIVKVDCVVKSSTSFVVVNSIRSKNYMYAGTDKKSLYLVFGT